jgi:outer membrane protein assembly factor BamB
MFVTPAVAGTTVYAGSCAGVYYAWDLRTGEPRWTHDFKPDPGLATFHGDPLLTEDVLVTGTEALDPPRVYAFDPEDGEVLWERGDAWALTGSDVVGVGRLAVGRNAAGELVALDRRRGDPVWRAGHEGAAYRPDVAESPAVVDGDVVFSAPDGAVYRIAGGSGEVVWRTALDCDVTTSVAADADDVFVGCRDGRLVRLGFDDGVRRTVLDLPAGPDGRLTLLADRVIVPAGVRWLGAVDRELGGVLWDYRPRPPTRLSVVQPLVWRGAVLTGNGDGELIALELDDGAVRWIAGLHGSVRGLGHHGDTLLVGTIEGTIFAVDGASLPPGGSR